MSKIIRNMGKIDRIVRLFAALLAALVAGFSFQSGFLSPILGIIGIVMAAIMILTSAVAICPLYLPFGINTLEKKKETGKTGLD